MTKASVRAFLRVVVVVVTALVGSSSAVAQDAGRAAPSPMGDEGPAVPSTTDSADLLQQLRTQVESLRREVDELRVRSAGSSTEAQAPRVGQPSAPAAAPKNDEEVRNVKNPPQLSLKGVTLTPGGFAAGETIWRSNTEQNDLISTFSGIPFHHDPRTQVSEFRASARQSRLSLLAEGRIKHVVISGYWEMDFLAAAPTANENQADGFQPRERQLFAQLATDSGWTLSVGQTWSLITMNRSGIVTRAEWSPATIDAQYVVGYNFARIYTARLTKSFSHQLITAALSAELPAWLVPGTVPKNVIGVPGGVLSEGIVSLGNGNNYTTGVAPDMIAKVAFDPGWGHYEIKGLFRLFRAHVLDGATYVNAGGGVGGGMIVPFVGKKLDFLAQGMYGIGTARFQDSGTADLVLRPNGELSLIPAASLTSGLEAHPFEKLNLYLYGGLEYQQRTFGTQNGVHYGYGAPTKDLSGCSSTTPDFSCKADYRFLGQIVPGAWYRLFKGNYGTFQVGLQYSLTTKRAWTGMNGDAHVTPSGLMHMLFSSVRYYIP